MRTRSKYRPKWLLPCLTVLVAAYLVTVTILSHNATEKRMMGNILITIHDTSELKFVTPEGLSRELGNLPQLQGRIPLSRLNLDSIERSLQALDKIEHVSVNILSNGKLLIDVYPMRPVARIFPLTQKETNDSYYINRRGKQMRADARYHLDVPVIVGDFGPATLPATSLLPLLDMIAADSLWSSMVSMIKVTSPTDIFLVPMVRGHVVNLGDTLNLADKLSRVKAMYRRVMPVHGWEYYDTISVKWDGQIVATRRDKSLPDPFIITEEENPEEVDASTMMVGGDVNAGQAVRGAPINPDMVIPANKPKNQ
ncbi:MAG: cell division protein FtsQ/DivIB [Paramuribaculum sp.]|nr:cell division protein FtsQ/DivIB [Paramuribaculum sp.]